MIKVMSINPNKVPLLSKNKLFLGPIQTCRMLRGTIMFRGFKIILPVLFACASNAFSQHLSHQVLVPAGGVTVAGGFNYSQTIGETAVEIIGDPDFTFTQGFQQPAIKALSTFVIPEGNGVLVYPNPVTKVLHIKLFGDVYRKFTIEVINLTGVIVNKINLGFNDSYFYTEQIDATRFMPGTYFVRVVSDDNLINRTFKIVKIETEQ
jgi:hypothetical protein